jgi:hypothetical protein
MPTSFLNLVDDNGTNTTGTLIDKAELQFLLLDTVPANLTTTGTVNNWAPGLDGPTITRWTGAADLIVTGLAGGVAGQRWTFKNVTAATPSVAYFPHVSGSSSAGNQFANMATSASMPVALNGAATWEHDGSFWRMIAYEQGSWIAPTFNAADYSAVGAMTWTLTAGDVIAQRYRLSGKTMSIEFYLATTTVGGTLNNALYLTAPLWGGFTLASQSASRLAYMLDNNVLVDAFARGNAGTVIQLFKTSFANWAASTNLTQVEGTMTFDIV